MQSTLSHFSLTSRFAGESKSSYGARFHKRLEELMMEHPLAEQKHIIEGIGLFLFGVEIAYLSHRGL